MKRQAALFFCIFILVVVGCHANQSPILPTATHSAGKTSETPANTLTAPVDTPAGTATQPQPEYFNDTSPDQLKLGNLYYEIGLSKTSGGIVYILDKATGKQISRGNLKGCLWRVAFSVSAAALDACAFTPGGDNQFSYNWSQENLQLILSYIPDATASKTAAVTVTIQLSTEKWFDLQLNVKNQRGYSLKEVAFPADLVFSMDAQTEALLPILPGVVLEPAFFAQGKDYLTTYMGFPGVFADFMGFSSSNGNLAIYSTIEKDRFTSVKLGFNFSGCTAESVCYTHRFQTSAANGSTWTAPRERLWVSASRLETVNAFRSDDSLADAPSLNTKLGVLYNQVAQSALYKADASQLGIAFKDYPALLAKIPYPGILHVLGFGPLGFDRNNPDFLPPAPQWGSTQDLAAMLNTAHSLGFLNMPYINPTWWDGESPTLKNLPADLTLANVVVIAESGGQEEECYGCPNTPHRGFVVSPYVPFVQQRLDQLLHQMKQELPSDLIFEDQIGARAPLLDFNPASPTIDAYTQGWIEHTRTYGSDNLMTELGFDALVSSETGFHGSILLQERQGLTDGYWGKGNWQVYPFVTIAARDKVLFYQHDLAPEAFTQNKATLAWNVAMGYNLSYDLFPSTLGGGVEDEFINVVGAFQKYVLAQYDNERVTDYTHLQPNATQTSFENYTAITNWDGNNPYPSGDMVLAPSGVLVTANDGSLTAGVFTTYHGAALSSGDHYLIETRQTGSIMVRQPMGADTDLTIPLLPGWDSSTALEVWAYAKDGTRISKAQVSIQGNNLTFHYAAVLDGTPAAYYQASKP